MRIAFTSCCDAVNDPEQRAWQVLAAQQPERIVLLGDCIYMDYGFGEHLRNGEPRGLSLPKFSRLMHESYARQWAVPTFRAAIANIPVHAIWDDHDFAWNNGRGVGAGEADDDHVPEDKRRLSRALFEQFRQALAEQPDDYPANPFPDGVVDEDGGGVQQTIDLPGGHRLHLTDGRSFREPRGKSASLLGAAQRDALQAQLLPEPAVNLIASGTVLKDWARYDDHDWLEDRARDHRILVLSGDIHEHDFRVRHRLMEATASAMAQPPKVTAVFGKKSEVFGLLDFDGGTIVVSLWAKGEQVERHVIALADWTAGG